MTRIVALIPAHNEAANIGKTVQSLLEQDYPVSRVVVISDNSTDDTVNVARAAGAIAYETRENKDKKAGALNQALEILLPAMEDWEYIFAVDADTIIAPNFTLKALKVLETSPEVGAVGGIFTGRAPKNILELAQSNEYIRYARQINRTRRTMVLSGTAAVIRVSALRSVKEHRGMYYDASALTEDMEMGLALKTVGWKLASPVECLCTTDLMPTVKDLHNQRVRWYRGAFENLTSYGFTKVTRVYWGQQAMLLLSTLMMSLYLLLTTLNAIFGSITLNPFWITIGLIFWTERIVTSWRNGPKGRILALTVLPELCYDLILQSAFVKALVLSIRKTNAEWHHV